ncbi:MAG: hypothetical protein ABUS56_07150 [Acidobacteriota bacterium]
MKRIGLFLLTAALALVTTPAVAQVDLAGNWVYRLHEDWKERSPGPDLGEFLGLPLNSEGRARALRYSANVLSMPERQCLFYPPTYVVVGPQSLRFWADTDPINGQVLAWNISAAVDRSPIKIWMDGRPRPSANALHSSGGFATGVWEGATLTALVTHFKEGYLRRNGVPSSDKATITMHITRHGDMLTITQVIDDPIYLARPHILSRTWQFDPGTNVSPVADPCIPAPEGLRDDGSVPSYMIGENPYVNEMAERYHIPEQAVMGGVETLYPEYRKTLKDKYVAPAMCARYCCGWTPGGALIARALKCNDVSSDVR